MFYLGKIEMTTLQTKTNLTTTTPFVIPKAAKAIYVAPQNSSQFAVLYRGSGAAPAATTMLLLGADGATNPKHRFALPKNGPDDVITLACYNGTGGGSEVRVFAEL